MSSNPICRLHHEIANPSIHEVNLNQSSAAKFASTSDIHRRPLPSNVTSGDSTSTEYNDPLLREGQNDNVEEVLQELQQTSPTNKFKQIRKKLGLPSMAILAIGTIVILATSGFLSFLWLSGVKNKTWQTIACNNWMTRAVSLTALAFRTAISMQAVILTSMLAGLALERILVSTMHLATYSIMRNVNNGPFYLAWLTCKASVKMDKLWEQIFLPLTLILVFLTALLSQFTLTALLSDLSLSPVLGLATSTTLSSHFIYNSTNRDGPLHQRTRGSSWLREPFYSTFAEYSEPGTNEDPAAVDTGPVFRAFLPLGEQQSRINIGDYKGVATVLDSRVVCVRPEVESAQFQNDGMLGSGDRTQHRFALNGSISASTSTRGVLFNPISYDIPYGCLVDVATDPDSVWRITLCQLSPVSIGLPSQFDDPAKGLSYGPTYLVLNVTTGVKQEWVHLTNGTDYFWISQYVQQVAAVRHESNGEWLDLVFTDNGTMRISASFCVTALDTADLFVHAFSGMNRTEPLAEYDINTTKYRYDKIRRQLGQRNEGSWIHDRFEDRGLLQLQPRPSWRMGTHPEDYLRPRRRDGNAAFYISWVRSAARFESFNLVTNVDSMNVSFAANYSAYLSKENGDVSVYDSFTYEDYFSSIYPDPSFASLLQDILQHGGDIAHGLSSLLTVQAASTYYDQLPQFDGSSETVQTSFELVLTPQIYRGYIAVLAVASTHLILLVIILFQFFTGTRISTIGNAWQTLAQIKDPLTEQVFDLNTLSSDREVHRWMKANADAKVGDNFSEARGTSSDEDEEHALPSAALRPDDVVGIRFASSDTRTELVRRR